MELLFKIIIDQLAHGARGIEHHEAFGKHAVKFVNQSIAARGGDMTNARAPTVHNLFLLVCWIYAVSLTVQAARYVSSEHILRWIFDLRPAVEFCRVVDENPVACGLVGRGRQKEVEQIAVIGHGYGDTRMRPVAAPDDTIRRSVNNFTDYTDHVGVIRRPGFRQLIKTVKVDPRMLFISKNSEQLAKFAIILILMRLSVCDVVENVGHLDECKYGTAPITSAIDWDMNSTCQPKPAVRAIIRLVSSNDRPPLPLALMRKPVKPPSLSFDNSASVIAGSSSARPLKFPFICCNASRVIRLSVPLALPVTMTARVKPSAW